MHSNLFDGRFSDDEVYEALKRDTARDSKSITIMDIILASAGLYLVRDLPTWDKVAALVFAFVAMRRLYFFIDQSNRNFFMHWLDWQRARKRGLGQKAKEA